MKQPVDLTLRVTRADPELHEIRARSISDHVEFKLVLLYDCESGVGEFEVNDGGAFAVTAVVPGRARVP